ncbi:MAG TPA: hypothetical protein VI027_08900 [Rubrobacteraceae bacterium]
MHKTTDINKTHKTGEAARTMSRTTQESAHTAMDYALRAQEINTELLRRTSQAWIEGFRYQARLSQGMAQAFFEQWGNTFASTTHVERPAQEQSRSEVTEPTTNGAQKDTEPSAEETQESTEVAAQDAQETRKSTEIAAEDAEKNTDTAAFPIDGYDEMNVDEVSERLDGLSADELKRVRKYEKRNKDRGSLRKEMKQKIEATS